MEQALYGNQYFPVAIDRYVNSLLDDAQQKAWQGAQKVGTFWGFGGVWGSIMNDNDALEEELGEVRRAQPAQGARLIEKANAVLQRQAILRDRIEKARVVKDAVPKK
jgi:hypothetical protein